MKQLIKKMNQRPHHFYEASRIHVQSALAVTPVEMMYNAEHGIPVASQMVDESQFYDGDTGRQVYIPNWYRRGYDIVDAWNDQNTSRSKLQESRRRVSYYEQSEIPEA